MESLNLKKSAEAWLIAYLLLGAVCLCLMPHKPIYLFLLILAGPLFGMIGLTVSFIETEKYKERNKDQIRATYIEKLKYVHLLCFHPDPPVMSQSFACSSFRPEYKHSEQMAEIDCPHCLKYFKR